MCVCVVTHSFLPERFSKGRVVIGVESKRVKLRASRIPECPCCGVFTDPESGVSGLLSLEFFPIHSHLAFVHEYFPLKSPLFPLPTFRSSWRLGLLSSYRNPPPVGRTCFVFAACSCSGVMRLRCCFRGIWAQIVRFLSLGSFAALLKREKHHQYMPRLYRVVYVQCPCRQWNSTCPQNSYSSTLRTDFIGKCSQLHQ